MGSNETNATLNHLIETAKQISESMDRIINNLKTKEIEDNLIYIEKKLDNIIKYKEEIRKKIEKQGDKKTRFRKTKTRNEKHFIRKECSPYQIIDKRDRKRQSNRQNNGGQWLYSFDLCLQSCS